MTTQQIKIHVLHTGLVKVDKALPFHGQYRNPLAFTGLFRSARNQITLPVSSYLIEHPKGLLLIDTGWHKTVGIRRFAKVIGKNLVHKSKSTLVIYQPVGPSMNA